MLLKQQHNILKTILQIMQNTFASVEIQANNYCENTTQIYNSYCLAEVYKKLAKTYNYNADVFTYSFTSADVLNALNTYCDTDYREFVITQLQQLNNNNNKGEANMLKKLITCKYTGERYYNINTINASEKAELQTIVNKWKNIEGDYSSTMLQGIAHYKCDSGILTDAYSTADAVYIKKHTNNAEEVEDAFYNNNVNKLQFLQCIAEQYNFSVKYKFSDEDGASLVADMEEQLVF